LSGVEDILFPVPTVQSQGRAAGVFARLWCLLRVRQDAEHAG